MPTHPYNASVWSGAKFRLLGDARRFTTSTPAKEKSMASGIREFLQSPKGKATAIGLIAVGLIAVAISIWSSASPPSEIEDANNPVFINAQTGQQKRLALKVGETIPPEWHRAELCYWTKDGKTGPKPTYVLLNKYKGKDGPT